MTLYREIEDDVFLPWAGEPLPTPLNRWSEPEEIEEDGKIVQKRTLETYIDDISHPPTIEQHWDDEELAAVRLYRPEAAEPVPEHHRILSSSVERVDDVVRFVNLTEEIPLNDRKAEMLAALADRRWRAETGGLTFDAMRIPTDRETQSVIARTVAAFADGDITGVVKFKMPFGFVHITESHLRAIKAAGAQHINACFDREEQITIQILSAEDHAALDVIDIHSGWPGEEI